MRTKWADREVRRMLFFFFQAEDGIRDDLVTGVQTCAFRSFDNSSAMIVCQIGAAPVIPEAMPAIGALLLFPTQTAVREFGVKPIVQLSLNLSEVPVFTETS